MQDCPRESRRTLTLASCAMRAASFSQIQMLSRSRLGCSSPAISFSTWVVQRRAQRCARRLELRKFDDEPGVRVRRAAHGDLDLERVPMQPAVRVSLRKRIEAVRRIEAEGKRQFDGGRGHGIPSSLWVCRLNRQRGCAMQ